MPKVNLTARGVQDIKAPEEGQVDYFDQQPGGLILRVTERGVKSWCVMYRYAGRLRRLTLGKYPILSLADARELAMQAHREVVLGRGPGSAKTSTAAYFAVNSR